MFWEILLSNLITTSIVGGAIVCYHYYRLKKEQEYYEGMKNKVADTLVIFSQCIVSYMAFKGYSDVATLKTILENHPVYKNKLLPWSVVDGIMQPAATVGTHGSSYDFSPFESKFESKFKQSPYKFNSNIFKGDDCNYVDSPYKIPKPWCGKINSTINNMCSCGMHNKNEDCDISSEESCMTEVFVPKCKKEKKSSKTNDTDVKPSSCDLKIEI